MPPAQPGEYAARSQSSDPAQRPRFVLGTLEAKLTRQARKLNARIPGTQDGKGVGAFDAGGSQDPQRADAAP